MKSINDRAREAGVLLQKVHRLSLLQFIRGEVGSTSIEVCTVDD